MSQKIVHNINNVVDKEKSEYYYINKRKRMFWHSKSISLSCRVREKNSFNDGPALAMNVRAFLLNEGRFFEKIWSSVWERIVEADQQQLRNYVYLKFREYRKEELDKKMGLIILSLEDDEKKAALNLEHVISCRLLGYEKEFFYLKCYRLRIVPVFMLRILYHTKYYHLKLRKWLGYQQKDGYELTDLSKGLEFEFYLDKIKFL
ncbi:MAG: hypothetical protein ACFFCI_09305 [Promethearchaeota archaeon]